MAAQVKAILMVLRTKKTASRAGLTALIEESCV
jgi:hypothetical protein